MNPFPFKDPNDPANRQDPDQEILRKYLSSINDPQRMAQQQQELARAAKAQEDAAYVASMADAASLMGATAGGSQADTSGFRQGLMGRADARMKLAQGQIGLQDAQQEKSNKVAEFLMNKNQQQRQFAEGEKNKRESQDRLFTQQKELDRLRGIRESDLAAQKAKSDEVLAGLKKSEGKQMTSQSAQEIGAFDSAIDMAEQIEKAYNSQAKSNFSGMKSMVRGSDADKYNKQRDVAAQTIGLVLEKGKLTDADYQRYKEMLPSPWDSNEIAQTKMGAIKNLILSKKRGEVGGLGQAGFNISNVPPVPGELKSNIDVGGGGIESTANAGTGSLKKYVPGKAYKGDKTGRIKYGSPDGTTLQDSP